MAISYSIVPEESLIVTRLVDSVSSQDLVEAYKAIYAHPETRPGFNELVLLHDDVMLNLSREALEEVAALTKAFNDSEGKTARSAIVMPNHFDHRIFKALHQFVESPAKSHEQVLSCFDIKQAAHWLGVDIMNIGP